MRNVSHSSGGGKITSLTFQIAGTPPKTLTVFGREAWALDQLMGAGALGCTPITHPGPRWSHYVWRLRGQGVVIETATEPHGGAYSGTHARYILRSKIKRIKAEFEGTGRSKSQRSRVTQAAQTEAVAQ